MRITAKEAIAATIEAGEIPTPFGGPNGHPSYDANHAKWCKPSKRYPYGCNTEDACAYCGKPCPTPKYFAALTCGGAFEDAANVKDGDLGFYPIGSDCASKLKKAAPIYKGSAACGGWPANPPERF